MLSIREKLAAMQRCQTDAPSVVQERLPLQGHEEVGLQCEETSHGTLWLRRKRFTAGQIPMYRLEDFLRLEPRQLLLVGKNPALGLVHPQKLLFIDTETTGLSGGAGTYAFLVGIAACTAEAVEVKQYFLIDPDAEKALYANLLDEFSGMEAMVSYNGKSYDLPLLRSRCVMNRIEYSAMTIPHLDLLHAIRRLCKGFSSYTLGEVETRLLQIRREEDIPGALIPGLYFEAMRSGDLAALKPVFQHNVMDLLSLVGLTAAAAVRFEHQEGLQTRDLLAVVKTLSDLQLYGEAERIGREALAAPMAEGWTALARQSAGLYKRRGGYAEAVKIWAKWVEQVPEFSMEPYEELAKYHEHKAGDIQAALAILARAEGRLEIVRELHNRKEHSEWAARLQHRKERLQRKLQLHRREV